MTRSRPAMSMTEEETPSIILVVDDEPSIRETLREFLEAFGYAIIEAADGAEALRILAREPVDLVITDIHMPEVSGLELLERAGKSHPYLPFILITGQPSVDAAVQCLRHGAADFISKPFDLNAIVTAIKTALDKLRNVQQAMPDSNDATFCLPGGYTYIKTLGEGTMGIVYLASELRPPQRLVALKMLQLDHVDYDQRRSMHHRFLHEVQAASMLDHPNIVRVYDYGTNQVDGVYVAMEYVRGKPLNFLIRHESLCFEDKLSILTQVADALCAIHRTGICHRDIKPANILIAEDLVPKLSDFGVARLPDSELTVTRQLLGSPSYMAPEAFGQAGSDPRCDIFSFGVVAYELLHGRRLFKGANMVEIMQQICRPDPLQGVVFSPFVPRPLVHLIRGCLRYSPEQRIQSAEEILRMLAACS